MERLKQQQYFVESFNKFNKKQRQEILKNLDNDQVKFFVEVCYNVLNGFPLVPNDRLKKLKKTHILKIRKVGNPAIGLKRKKKLLIRGGVVGAIVSTLAGIALQSLVEKIVESQKKNEREGEAKG